MNSNRSETDIEIFETQVADAPQNQLNKRNTRFVIELIRKYCEQVLIGQQLSDIRRSGDKRTPTLVELGTSMVGQLTNEQVNALRDREKVPKPRLVVLPQSSRLRFFRDVTAVSSAQGRILEPSSELFWEIFAPPHINNESPTAHHARRAQLAEAPVDGYEFCIADVANSYDSPLVWQVDGEVRNLQRIRSFNSYYHHRGVRAMHTDEFLAFALDGSLPRCTARESYCPIPRDVRANTDRAYSFAKSTDRSISIKPFPNYAVSGFGTERFPEEWRSVVIRPAVSGKIEM